MPATRCAVVVLPLVPVTPTTCRAREGCAVPARRHERQGTAHRGHQHLRDGLTRVALAHQRGGAGRDTAAGREVVAVGLESGDAKEKRAVGDVTRVVGEAPYLDARVAAYRCRGDLADQLR